MGNVLLLAGLVFFFLIPGWLAYTGRWRDWARAQWVLYAPLAGFWIGAGGVVFTLGVLMVDTPLEPLGLVLGVIGLAGYVLGGLFLFWTPKRLQPQWLKDTGLRGTFIPR